MTQGEEAGGGDSPAGQEDPRVPGSRHIVLHSLRISIMYYFCWSSVYLPSCVTCHLSCVSSCWSFACLPSSQATTRLLRTGDHQAHKTLAGPQRNCTLLSTTLIHVQPTANYLLPLSPAMAPCTCECSRWWQTTTSCHWVK